MDRRYRALERMSAGAAGTTARDLFFAAGLIYVGWWVINSALFALFGAGLAQGDTRLGFVLNMATFAILIGLTARVARALHSRPWPELLGDWSRLRSDFLGVLIACGLVYAVLIGMGFQPSQAQMRPLSAWLAFLPIALLGIVIQTGAEELFFRGYLQQYCARALKSPYAWMVVPSLIFGVSHALSDTSTAGASLAYIVWTTCFGLAAADLTARTGSLGAAWGLHMAVNIAALLIANQDGAPMSAAALYIFPARAEDYVPSATIIVIQTLFELAFLAILWLAARNVIRR
ncbi:MAG: type II CAAX endopeptidase family protein [Pseudomonadota bacterium]